MDCDAIEEVTESSVDTTESEVWGFDPVKDVAEPEVESVVNCDMVDEVEPEVEASKPEAIVEEETSSIRSKVTLETVVRIVESR